MQGNRWFGTDSQVCIRASDSDPMTGTFHHMHVTVGDTAYSMNGVLQAGVTSHGDSKLRIIGKLMVLVTG